MSDDSKKRRQPENGETPKKRTAPKKSSADRGSSAKPPKAEATKPATKKEPAKSGARKGSAGKSSAAKSSAVKSKGTEAKRPRKPAYAPKAEEVITPETVEVPQHAATRRAQPSGLTPPKLLVVLGLMALAFFGAYNYASSATANAADSYGSGDAGLFSSAAAPAGGGCGMSGGSGGGGGCCGGGGAPVEGATTVDGELQTIDIDTSQGSFNPNIIKAKAGVPIEINFSQAPGGCLSGVYFPDFDINEDLTSGAKTVKLPALEKGEYTFYCQMQMISATLVVE